MDVVVVGGGSWGTAFARLLRDHGHAVTLACRDPAQAESIRETGRNPRYLSHVDLSDVAAETVEDAPLEEANLVVVAVPSESFARVVDALPGGAPILSLTKGLDPATGDRLSTLVQGRPVAVLSGPNIAEEVARGLPAAAVIACLTEGEAAFQTNETLGYLSAKPEVRAEQAAQSPLWEPWVSAVEGAQGRTTDLGSEYVDASASLSAAIQAALNAAGDEAAVEAAFQDAGGF